MFIMDTNLKEKVILGKEKCNYSMYGERRIFEIINTFDMKWLKPEFDNNKNKFSYFKKIYKYNSKIYACLGIMFE